MGSTLLASRQLAFPEEVLDPQGAHRYQWISVKLCFFAFCPFCLHFEMLFSERVHKTYQNGEKVKTVNRNGTHSAITCITSQVLTLTLMSFPPVLTPALRILCVFVPRSEMLFFPSCEPVSEESSWFSGPSYSEVSLTTVGTLWLLRVWSSQSRGDSTAAWNKFCTRAHKISPSWDGNVCRGQPSMIYPSDPPRKLRHHENCTRDQKQPRVGEG